MQIDKKTLIIIILSVALAIVSYIAFKSEPISYDKELIDKRLKVLEDENTSLKENSALERTKQIKYLHQIDSLGNLKPQIQIKYVNKTKEIDNASVNGVISDFNSVFTNSNIK